MHACQWIPKTPRQASIMRKEIVNFYDKAISRAFRSPNEQKKDFNLTVVGIIR